LKGLRRIAKEARLLKVVIVPRHHSLDVQRTTGLLVLSGSVLNELLDL
jgi:hypothetical protein